MAAETCFSDPLYRESRIRLNILRNGLLPLRSVNSDGSDEVFFKGTSSGTQTSVQTAQALPS